MGPTRTMLTKVGHRSISQRDRGLGTGFPIRKVTFHTGPTKIPQTDIGPSLRIRAGLVPLETAVSYFLNQRLVAILPVTTLTEDA
jgi:hypothetical protein